MKPVKLGEEVVYEGRKFRVKVEEYEYEGRVFTVEKVEHPGAVVVVPVLSDGRIVYIEQYRPVVEEWVVELPAGTIAEGEEPAETAARELEEEVGYRPSTLAYLGVTYPSPGYTNERIHVLEARGLVKSRPRREPHEVLKVRTAALEELLKMIATNRVRDSKTIVALTLYYLKAAEQELESAT